MISEHFKEAFEKTSGVMDVLEKVPQFADDIIIYGNRYKKSKEQQQKGLAKKANHWLDVGAQVETEHTKDLDKAREIAQDHLDEDPDYYKDWDNKEKILFQKRAGWLDKIKGVEKLGPQARRVLRNHIRRGIIPNPVNLGKIYATVLESARH